LVPLAERPRRWKVKYYFGSVLHTWRGRRRDCSFVNNSFTIGGDRRECPSVRTPLTLRGER